MRRGAGYPLICPVHDPGCVPLDVTTKALMLVRDERFCAVYRRARRRKADDPVFAVFAAVEPPPENATPRCKPSRDIARNAPIVEGMIHAQRPPTPDG